MMSLIVFNGNNVFRLAGDLIHLSALIFLLYKICKTRSCSGISGRSQILFALVYTTRYLDLFSYFISMYNSVMKIVFVSILFATLFLMFFQFKSTYDKDHDTFRIEFLLIPVVILALVVNHEFAPLEVLWTFSIYLESVAILPQMFMVLKIGKAGRIASRYLLCLGFYKVFYILNWAYRYYDKGFYDLIAITAGIVQTIIYCVFFLIYITKKPDAQKYFLQNLQYEFLHSDEVTDRDWKKKILLAEQDNVKISDFGPVTIFSDEEKLLNNKCETSPYITPKVLSRNYEAEPADVLSSGMLVVITIPEDTVLGSRDNSSYKCLGSDLEEPSAERDESNSKLSFSQLAPVESNLEKPPCLPVDISFSVPIDPDNILSKQFSASQTLLKNVLEKDTLITRFSITMDVDAAYEELKKALNKHAYCWELSAPRQITITAQDKMKMELIFTADLISMPDNVLVDFRKTRGDELEFRSHFLRIKESLSHIIL